MKRFVCGLIASVMLLGNGVVAFATEKDLQTSTDEASIVIDLDQIDLSKPYKVEKQYINDAGDKVTIGAVYTPPEKTDSITPFGLEEWSHSYQASEGTWTSYYDGSIINQMSYEFDVSHPTSHWKISNARNLVVNMLITQISNKSVVINRSTSSIGMPAEVTGSCTLKIINTPIGPVSTVDAWIKTTVSDDGVLTVSGN